MAAPASYPLQVALDKCRGTYRSQCNWLTYSYPPFGILFRTVKTRACHRLLGSPLCLYQEEPHSKDCLVNRMPKICSFTVSHQNNPFSFPPFPGPFPSLLLGCPHFPVVAQRSSPHCFPSSFPSFLLHSQWYSLRIFSTSTRTKQVG